MDDPSTADSKQRFCLTSERAREREVYRHLRPWLDTYKSTEATQRSAFPSESHSQPRTPQPCSDTALAAFAQLCALRLHAHRCLVSLISSTTEHVLVESTRTISLQYDVVEDERDKLWLGTCDFPRDDGVNASAVETWRKARSVRPDVEDDDEYFTDTLSSHVCVISDLRNNHDHRDRLFTRHCPSNRFYVSVPLRTTQGVVLGAVTVLDNKPRYGISAFELNLMEDIADTVAGHLDAVIVRSVRQRSQRLIQGLGLFNSGKSSLRHWWIRQEESRLSNVGRHTNKEMSSSDRLSRMDREFGTRARDQQGPEPVSPSRRRKRGASARSHSGAPDPPATSSPRPAKRKAGSSRPTKSRSRVTEDTDPSDLPAAFAQTYARASNLIREALGCEGVVMLNAGAIRISRRTSGAAVAAGGSSSSPASGEDADPIEDPLCAIQGFSTRTKDSLRESHTSALRFGLTESGLLRLVRRYPHGQVFNFGEGGSLHSSSVEDGVIGSSEDYEPEKPTRRLREGQVLADIIPDVRSVTFYPLWDDNQEFYRSCIFLWSTAPMRFFHVPEDLTYLNSWAHSLVAELSRLEMRAADRAKSTFISSVSHELRSPLHGVLAGVELLSDTHLTVFQKEMAQSISMAGNTLLDTVNHILDYSKISNFTRAQKKARTALDASRHRAGQSADPHEMGVRFDIDLARLTEEVVETTVSARRHERLAAKQLRSPQESSVDQQHRLYPKSSDEELSVTLEIAPRQSWITELQPGGWTRIINNLVGNALKFTSKGNVTVRLAASDHARQIDGEEHFKVTLTVDDTGIGMSNQFLSHHLYTPFKQADSHSTGTGLGLSIVRSIAEDLGATLNVRSELGRGTTATLDFFTTFSHTNPSRSSVDGALLGAPDSLDCSRLHLFSPKTITEPSDASMEERNFLHTAKEWLRCDVSTGPISPTDETIYVVDERHLPWLLNDTSGLPSFPAGEDEPSTNLLVLAASTEETKPDRLPANWRPVFVQQPIGPRKLFRAVSSLASQGSPESRKPDLNIDTSSIRQSRIQRGSTTSDQPARETPASATDNEEPATEKGQKLLLVEDNDINMKLLVAFARKLKLDYQCASHGGEAVDAFTAAPRSFTVVFMDMQMPVMDGFTATALIRQEESKRQLPPVPIVALTGVTNPEAKERAFDSGVNEYLSKPVTMKELQALVEKLSVADDAS